ncbi:DUF177 domain-containing protein [Maritimibacter sp. HL-12]|uniref:YceD family protein n=1 Tax=Maritimibacter sp. HL-12 TaxID=1162418 RepID=UPI000A0F3162|nr:DUF177 domain-containing protein [Maritimibacter sp. HL-12]SMH30182.1 Uncharacterized metal-binding protein YceD, DUF177 family [Maritimibacter sp. HL-12]
MRSEPRPARFGPVLRVAELAPGQSRDILIEPQPQVCADIAELLDLTALRKLRLQGVLAPLGRRDWRFSGHLGATVVQPCVVTLAPVTTRIEDDITRTWRADFAEPEADEVEIPEIVEEEPLGTEIDLGAMMIEALALALPDYPRAEGVALGEAVFAAPGTAPMTDDDAKPFAGLAALREKLADDDDDDETGDA